MTKMRKAALSAQELSKLTDAELTVEQLAYKQAVADIETQIEALADRGEEIFPSTRSALRHYRASLGFIKDIRKVRHNSTADSDRLIGELYRAAGAILDDDNDANWDRLQAAYEAMPAPSKNRISA